MRIPRERQIGDAVEVGRRRLRGRREGNHPLAVRLGQDGAALLNLSFDRQRGRHQGLRPGLDLLVGGQVDGVTRPRSDRRGAGQALQARAVPQPAGRLQDAASAMP